jgi:hypothetical protein
VDTLHTGQNGSVASQDGGLTLAEAASRLGVAPRTVRRRIQRSEIVAELVQGDHGAEYRVWLDRTPARTPDRPTAGQGSQRGEPALSRLAGMLETAQRELVAKAEAAAMWQARAELLAERVKALEAQLALPPPADASTSLRSGRPWWKFW